MIFQKCFEKGQVYLFILKKGFSELYKNESNYFVTCKYFGLILQPLQTVMNVR